jgi:hypothetical protein
MIFAISTKEKSYVKSDLKINLFLDNPNKTASAIIYSLCCSQGEMYRTDNIKNNEKLVWQKRSD